MKLGGMSDLDRLVERRPPVQPARRGASDAGLPTSRSTVGAREGAAGRRPGGGRTAGSATRWSRRR